MKTPNAINVCNQFFRLCSNCNGCPIMAECDSKPQNPDAPADWEERIEKAATEYLKKQERETK